MICSTTIPQILCSLSDDPLSCSPPPEIPFANITIGVVNTTDDVVYSIGTSVTYTCDNNTFDLVCSDNMTWCGETAECSRESLI